MIILAQLIFGLILLIAGGEVLVRGAISLAKNLGIPTAVIGLTVLAYGTSAPELVVSLEAALDGYPDMALGNVVGSNISNTLLILGATAMVYPLTLSRRLLKPDGLILLGVTGLLFAFAASGMITRLEGVAFLAITVAYTVYTFRKGKRQGFAEIEAELEEEAGEPLSLTKSVLYTIVGLAVMVMGGKLMVWGGVAAAHWFGVAEGVVGLTILAIGTSLPELTTSLLAARKGEADMAVGNVIGSNLLNIFGIVGITALATPLSVADSFLIRDIPLLFGCTLLLVLGLAFHLRIGRGIGALGIGGFIGYIALTYSLS